jgi:hypothetical protein
MRRSLSCVVAVVSLLGVAGCRDDRPPPRVVRTEPTYHPSVRDFNIPARAIENTRWAKRQQNDPNPVRGDIPKGDYVLMRRSEDALPAWVDAYYPPQGTVQVQPEHFTTEKFTSVAANDTPYYPTVPTARRTATGTIRGGTSVIVIRDVGQYREVFTADGVHGYVAATDVSPARP